MNEKSKNVVSTKRKRTSDYNYFSDLTSSDVIVTEDLGNIEAGEIFREYKVLKNGLEINETFIPKGKFVRLDEKLSRDDEKEVKEIIKKQLKYTLWQLYTKQNIFVGNI